MTPLPDKVELDDILNKFRLTGRYHVVTMILVILANVTNAMFYTNYIFIAEATPYRCKDNTANNRINDTLDKGPQCSSVNSTGCSEWTYDNPNSFVAEFGLACQEWKRTLVGTMHSFGCMVGLLIVGPLSDRFGRKSMVATVGVIGAVLGLVRSFSTNYWLYIGLEFLEAVIGDTCSPVYTLAIEIVATKNRVPFITICWLGFALGGLLYSLIAWLVPYWRTFLRVLYTPGLLLSFYVFLIDESPRWLLTKGGKDAAVAILKKAAKMSKVDLDPEELKRLTYDEVKGASFATMLSETFKSRALLKRFFVCSVWWIASTFVNHGLTINSVSLQGNKYVNYALLSVIDVPGALIVAYILMKFKRKVPLILTFMTCAVLCVGQPFVPKELPGILIVAYILMKLKRKLPLIMTFMTCAVLCIAQPFVPKDMAWLSVLVYMSGKLMSSFYFTITYIFTSELFPTYTRNSMHALCSSIGRIGSIVAPQTPLLLVYWSGLPALIFGLVSLTAGLLTLLVPDTADNSLPDTVCQAEAIGYKLENNHYLRARKNSKDFENK